VLVLRLLAGEFAEEPTINLTTSCSMTSAAVPFSEIALIRTSKTLPYPPLTSSTGSVLIATAIAIAIEDDDGDNNR
jgi:hypothetical protein